MFGRFRDEPTGRQIHRARHNGDLCGDRTVELDDLVVEAEDLLAFLPIEHAGHRDLVATAQLALVLDGGLEHHRADAAGDELVLRDPRRAHQLPPGVLAVLVVDGVIEVALGVELVAADEDRYGERHTAYNRPLPTRCSRSACNLGHSATGNRMTDQPRWALRSAHQAGASTKVVLSNSSWAATNSS